MSKPRGPWSVIGAAGTAVAAVLAVLAVPSGSQAVDATAAAVTATPTNGGLGWSGGFTAAQRLDRLDGSTDALPANVGPDAVFNRAGNAILAYRGGTMYELRSNGIVRGYPEASVPPDLHGHIVTWADDESYSVIVTETGTYRIINGRAPVKLPAYFGGGVPRAGDGLLTMTLAPDTFHRRLY